jgi:hypothetical protein
MKIDPGSLTTDEAREAALDTLGQWLVDELARKPDDGAHCTAAMTAAVVAFYDIRESADQPRGEYAGHFFLVDAVGLGDADRPVPWVELSKRVTSAQLDQLQQWFDVAERAAR